MAIIEYKPGSTFPGVIARTVDQSSPAWLRPLRAREGAANVLFIVLDDLGYGQLGCYGAPIHTPNLDALGCRWSALQQLPHHGALLAHPHLPADRSQPPLQRHGLHHRGRYRLSRQQWDNPR